MREEEEKKMREMREMREEEEKKMRDKQKMK